MKTKDEIEDRTTSHHTGTVIGEQYDSSLQRNLLARLHLLKHKEMTKEAAAATCTKEVPQPSPHKKQRKIDTTQISERAYLEQLQKSKTKTPRLLEVEKQLNEKQYLAKLWKEQQAQAEREKAVKAAWQSQFQYIEPSGWRSSRRLREKRDKNVTAVNALMDMVRGGVDGEMKGAVDGEEDRKMSAQLDTVGVTADSANAAQTYTLETGPTPEQLNVAKAADGTSQSDGGLWWYPDQKGNVQGPFTGKTINNWLQLGYFKGDFSIGQEKTGPFYPLSMLLTRTQHLQLVQQQKQIEERSKQGGSEPQSNASDESNKQTSEEAGAKGPEQEVPTDESNESPAKEKDAVSSRKPWMSFGKKRLRTKLEEALQQIEELKAEIAKLKCIPPVNPFEDPNDPYYQPQPLEEGVEHRLKYPTMSRYNIFPSATHGPSLHTTKQLLQDIVAFQRTITNRDSVELYNSRANLDTICAVLIPRHKDDNAFESYNRKRGHYVKDIVEQMSIPREKEKNERKKKDRASQVLEELLKQDASKEKEETKVSDNPTKANLDIGASRLLRYLARKHENVFIQVATERGYISQHIDDLSQAAMWVDAKIDNHSQIKLILKHLRARLGSNVLGSFASMNKIRTDPEWEVEIKQRIEWVHAQTARGSYKKAGDDGDGGGDNNDDQDPNKPKPKSKSAKKKKHGVKRKFLPESLVDAYDNVPLTPDSDWYHFFNEIQNFRHKYGHYNTSPVLHKLLHQWMKDQRQEYSNNTLKDNRKYLLNMIQFPFETVKNPAITAASEWSKMYNELRNFHTQRGHARVVPTDNAVLYRWTQEQQEAYKQNTLTDNRKYLLDQVQFPFASEWSKMYNELRNFHTQRGHVRVLPTDNAALYRWTQEQQEAYKQNTLTDNRKYLLDQVQFPFESTLTVAYEEQHLKPDSDWYNYYKELSTFHAKNGHCRVFPEENELLYQWTIAQRKAFEDGELNKNRKFLLDQVNFPWPSQRK